METLLHAGLSNAISATFLALLVACLSRVLARRPAILHCLWLLVLLKLITPPLYEVPIPWPETLTAGSDNAANADVGSIDLTGAVYYLDVSDLAESEARTGPTVKAPVLAQQSAYEGIILSEETRAAIENARLWLALHWMPIVAGLWLAGTLASLAIAMRRIIRFQAFLREARPGSDEIQDWVDELAANLGIHQPPRVWWIGRQALAHALGSLRPAAADHSQRALEVARRAAARDSARARAGPPSSRRSPRADLRARRDRALLVEPRCLVGAAVAARSRRAMLRRLGCLGLPRVCQIVRRNSARNP